ncbi:MAG: putative RNA methyltransferase [Propionicimonas sp.]|nr:methyltransferase domain-containing protein [Propionicimonas sp.]
MGIAAAGGLLACPHCGGDLELGSATARCARGHSFDIARQGYLNLLAGPQPGNADTAAMVAARGRVLGSGAFDRVLGLVAHHSGPARRVLEVGAGTGDYLRRSLGDNPDARGLAVDVSVPAARMAARADGRIASVVADVWSGLPVRDHCVDTVLCVFAPRNLVEFARVLVPAGRLLVLTPNPGHLAVLRERYGLLSIHPDKQERLLAAASEFFDLRTTSRIRTRVELTPALAADVIGMGPNAFHDPELPGAPVADHLDATLRVFEPVSGTPGIPDPPAALRD